MAVHGASAEWQGSLKEGAGKMRLGSGAFEGPYTFVSRFETGPGTNPEELIGAAHAGCFSMALSGALTKSGHPPEKIETSAEVGLVKEGEGFRIPTIKLKTAVKVAGLDDAKFQEIAKAAKENCPVSKVLAGAEISLDAKLLS
jgi:osmotically inducible protein OsmC